MRDGGGRFGANLVEEGELVFEAGESIGDALMELSGILHDTAGTLAIIIANVGDGGDGSSTGDDERGEAKIFGEAAFGVGEMIRPKKLGAIGVEPGVFGIMIASKKRKSGEAEHGRKAGFGARNSSAVREEVLALIAEEVDWLLERGEGFGNLDEGIASKEVVTIKEN